MSDSTIYTIGTALNRARDHDLPVRVLVEGQWLGGHVSAVDGHGLVLATDEQGQSVVRMQSISAVSVLSAPAARTQAPPPAAQPMPGPRFPEGDHHEGPVRLAISR
jgi:hypothetical protein